MLLPEGLNPGSYTPFTADNRLNEKALHEELERVTQGSGGLHGPAVHSEFASLTFDEWKVWTDVLVDVAKKAKIPAWSFFGSESLEKTIPYGEYALKAGADGFIVMAPYFNLYNQEAAYLYYKDLAKEFPDTPILIYPAHETGNHFEPATIAKIAQLPNIAGMKLNGDFTFNQFSQIIRLTCHSKTFAWLAGGLNVLYPMVCSYQFKASCSSLSNFAHEWSLNFWKAYQERDWATVERWQGKLIRVQNVLSGGSRGAGHKAGLELLGRNVGQPRRPGMPASAEHVARIKKVFQEEGLL
jgi:4-hydroxy-tetrahydrodipicolinate synthase